MEKEKLSAQDQQLKLMKLQTILMGCILILLLAVALFLVTQVTGVVAQVNDVLVKVNNLDLDEINQTVEALHEAADGLAKMDVEVVNGAISSLKAAADHLGDVDIDAINEGIEALSGAGKQLQDLDMKKLNSVIESLGTVTAQLEKTTGTISRNPVNRTVRQIRTPCAFNLPVSWVFSDPEEEHTVYALPVRYDKQPVLRNVLPKLRRGRICFAPLIWISVFCHKVPGIGVDFLNFSKIRQLCRTNCIFHDPSPFFLIIHHLHGFRNSRAY